MGLAIKTQESRSADRSGVSAKTVIVWSIGQYKRRISPLLPHSCRFYPTCSQYCIEAVEKYGALRGLFVGIKRILRCNQFFKGGIDPLN